MEAGLRTPLLDFFRRGEVARDVRLMAAQGAVAPRPLEQLGILMILSSDADSEIRDTANATLRLLPDELVASFIARSDVPTELRAFFVGRGIAPRFTEAAWRGGEKCGIRRPFRLLLETTDPNKKGRLFFGVRH